MTALPFTYVYFGDTAMVGEQYVEELRERGAVVSSASIAYGPTPAKVEGFSYGQDAWHVLVLGEWPTGEPTG